MFGLTKLGSESISLIKNPFSQTGITGISVYFSKSDYNGTWSASGRVKFKNGNTEGEQKFEAQTFDEVVDQMKIFVQSLEKG